MIALIEQDIAHIARVMRPSLVGDMCGAILPTDYWRARLQRLRDSAHLTTPQLHAIESLFFELNSFERDQKAHAKRAVPAARHTRAAHA